MADNITLSAEAPLAPFDSTPITAALFLRNIGEYAAKKGFLTLLLRSYYISRDQITIVANADLIPALRQAITTDNHPVAEDIQTPPDPPAPATRDTTYTPTTADSRLYTASPELFMSRCTMHCQELLSAISDPDIARRVRSAANNDARLAILEIARMRDEVTAAQVAHHLTRNLITCQDWNPIRICCRLLRLESAV